MELIILTKVEGKGPQKMDLVVHVVGLFPSKAVMTIDCDGIWDQSIIKTEISHGWQLAMCHMVKSRLNHFKHINLITDGVQCHLLMENHTRLMSVAKKFIDFYCCLSH